MPKRLRYDVDDYSFTPDSFSLLHTTSSLGLPESDAAWMFETNTDTDPTQIQFSDRDTAWVFETENDPMPRTFSNCGFSEMDSMQPLPLSESRIHINTNPNTNTNTNTSAHLLASHDLSAGYQTSNGSSGPVPASKSTSASSAMFLGSSSSSSSLSSSSPRVPVAVEALPPHIGQVNLCRSLCRSETSCLAAALRALTTLHVAHSACLSAHQEAPTVQQARNMETVLSTNKDAIASMAPILACSCSGKSLVQLLRLSICGNLVAWNSAMISADLESGPCDPFSFSSAGSGSGSRSGSGSGSLPVSAGPSQQAPRARVLPQPITIGQHQINGKLGRALHAQVMASELRILEGLVDALSRRFCEASRSDSAGAGAGAVNLSRCGATTSRDTPPLSSQQSKPLSHVVHRHIISSLRTRLEDTRARIFSGLGQVA